MGTAVVLANAFIMVGFWAAVVLLIRKLVKKRNR